MASLGTVRGLKRFALRELSKQARPYLNSYGLLKTVKYKRAMVGDPGAGRVLVLAPHMDDEVIGCGGAIYKHIRRGADVTVVFITDGRYGSRDLAHLSGDARRRREKEVAAERKLEAEEALKVLGVQRALYWEAEESMLTITPELPVKLAELVASLRPDAVYLPFFLEEHADHRAVSQILLEATESTGVKFDCFGYEVWTPLFPNYLVEIGDVIDVKRQALSKYRSQLAETNYLHTAFGLNAFRSSALLETGGYAEAFYCAPLRDYLDLYRSLAL